MDYSAIFNALCSAWERKRPLSAETEALRLLNAEASGTPRLVFEVYGKHGVFYDYGTGLTESLRAAAPGWLETFGWNSISLMDRLIPGEKGRGGNYAVAGEVPEALAINEGPLRFRIESRHPRNVGLFLDTRGLRTWLREHVRGKSVLNLFAYTGSLGLAALSGEAREVVQVDISERYLEWGRENLRLNSLPKDNCRFTRMDGERYLDWATKKGLAFDHIILDPPVFSRFDGRVFRFEDDYFRLASKAITLLSPAGTLHAVTNYSGITASEFRIRLEESIQAANRNLRDLRRFPLPPDFDIPLGSEIRPEGNALIFQVEVQ